MVSGLRGAADASGDGMVTLGEAYQYAFGRTVSATSDTLVGPQHPVYDYRLTGRGELVLTRLHGAAGVLETPAGFDRLLLVDRQRQEVVAELGGEGARRLATRPGTYEVRAWRGRGMYRGRVAVVGGGTAKLSAQDLHQTPGQSATAKGDAGLWAEVERPRPPWRLAVAAGAGRAVGEGVGEPLPGSAGLRLELLLPRAGQVLVLSGRSGRGPGFRETQVELRFGRHLRWGERLRLVAGAEVGAGMVLQRVDGGRWLHSPVGVGAPVLGAEWQVSPAVTLRLLADGQVALTRREGKLVPVLLPAAWLGAVF